MRRRFSLLLATALVAPFATGCGDDSRPLTSVEAKALRGELDRARVAAAQGSVAGASAALHDFRNDVVRLRRAGALGDGRAEALLVGARRVEKRIREGAPAHPGAARLQRPPAGAR